MTSDFSSWPRDQEQSFVVYENRARESQGKALTGGLIAGAAFFVLMFGIYVGVPPENKDMTKGMNMDNLTKKSKKVEPAPTPTPAPAAAPAPAPAAPSADKPADPAPAK